MGIYLARHGQDEDNAKGILNGHRDTPLTKLGIEQSKKLAKEIKKLGIKFNKIYTSPLKRALQTAEIISSALGNEKSIILKDLIERDFGRMTGKPIKNIEALCSSDIIKTEFTVYFLSEDGAETFPQLFERAKQVLNTVEINYPKDNILLVTHGDLGKMIYAAYYQLAWQDVLKLFPFKNSELLVLSPNKK